MDFFVIEVDWVDLFTTGVGLSRFTCYWSGLSGC